MATRNRNTNVFTNQENVKNTKAAPPIRMRRPVLGEIGNKVNMLRGVEPLDRISLLQKDTKKMTVTAKQHDVKLVEKVPEKVTEKPLLNEVNNLAIFKTANIDNADILNMGDIFPIKKEEDNAFSTGLLKFEDIDEQDEKNPILVSNYTNEIHEYLRTLENKFPIRDGYLVGQEVTSKMRSVLIDWLIEVHQQFRLMQETLYLTVATIDRFLQIYKGTNRKTLQLVGVTAMFIASKYEEMYCPDICDFVYITDKAYTKSDILQMEVLIVKTLDFSFGRPLPLHFLRRYSKAGKALPTHHTMAKYFLEQSLVHYELCHYMPSLIAAAAIYLAFLIIGNDEEDEGKIIWTNTLAHYSTYSKDDVLPAVRDIATIIINAEKSKYQAVRKKYSQTKHMKVSVRPELKSPIIHAVAARSNET